MLKRADTADNACDDAPPLSPVREVPAVARRRVLAATFTTLKQIGLVGVLYLAYHYGRLLASGETAEAFQNAVEIWHLERAIGLPSEAALQTLVIGQHGLVQIMDIYYIGFHFPVTIAFMIWLWIRHRHEYFHARNALALSTFAGLAIHLAFPLAPPRMLSLAGMVDTGRVFGPSPYAGPVASLANQFAAMPSLHVGWSLLVAVFAWRIAPRDLRFLGPAHAVMTSLVVVLTANHYWLDGIAGGALVMVAIYVTMPRRTRMSRVAALAVVPAPLAERPTTVRPLPHRSPPDPHAWPMELFTDVSAFEFFCRRHHQRWRGRPPRPD